MAKQLTDTQAIILSNASQRDDLSVLPLPDTLKISDGALKKSLTALLTRGLVEETGSPFGDADTQQTEYRITAAGLAAIGIQDEAEHNAATNAAGNVRKKKANATASVKTSTAKHGAKPTGKPTGKPELLLRLMRRKQGATAPVLQDAAGWQPHSVRAALSGFRKKGIGITRSRNPKGETVYRAEG